MRERRLFVTDGELATLVAALRQAGQHAAAAGGHENAPADDAPAAQDFDQLRERLERLAGGGDDLRITDWVYGDQFKDDGLETCAEVVDLVEQMMATDWFEQFPGLVLFRADNRKFYTLTYHVNVVEETPDYARQTIEDELEWAEKNDPARAAVLKRYLAELPAAEKPATAAEAQIAHQVA